MSQPLLLLHDAAFGYGRDLVVQGVNLKICAGDFVALVGPNGGGKSTLLRGAIGLIPKMSGRLERAASRLGYVPQRDTLDALYPWTVLEVVQQGAYGRLSGPARGLGKIDRQEAISSLDRVGLGEKASAPFSSLSGGQRQRTLIARALMMRPELLALDEPTSGIDTEAKADIFDLLKQLQGEGLAILLVSHDLELVARTATEVIRVGDGRALRSASPSGGPT